VSLYTNNRGHSNTGTLSSDALIVDKCNNNLEKLNNPLGDADISHNRSIGTFIDIT